MFLQRKEEFVTTMMAHTPNLFLPSITWMQSKANYNDLDSFIRTGRAHIGIL